MKARDLCLSSLMTYQDHLSAIEKIENDYHNVIGGYKRWLSGYETELTATAKAKIAAIERQIEKKFPTPEEGEN